jgi:acyl carrier protein
VGLDTVELVMAIEEGFALEIPNETAATLTTVGDMHAYLVSELARLGRVDREPERVYQKLREIICRETGVQPDEVVPRARFVEDFRMD